jgi:hypothetical protein
MFIRAGKENTGVGGKKGYLYSSSCDLIHTVRFLGEWTQNGPVFVLHNHQASYEWGASRRYIALAVRTVCHTAHCFAITYHIYHSDLVQLRANWVILKLYLLCNHRTRLPTPSNGKSTRNWCHRIENTSLFALRCFYLCQRGISSGKLKMYTIYGSMYRAKNECSTMIIAPRRHKHPASSATRSWDVAVIVHTNVQFNLSLIWWR